MQVRPGRISTPRAPLQPVDAGVAWALSTRPDQAGTGTHQVREADQGVGQLVGRIGERYGEPGDLIGRVGQPDA